jgi:hypothetical protein
MKEKKLMTTRRVEMERFSLISSKAFQSVLAALESAVGDPDMAEFAKGTKSARNSAGLEDFVRRGLGESGLMLFLELDHGSILRKETGLDTPRIVRLLIGNPLIMKEMAKQVPDAGSYAPVTICWMSGPTACISPMTGCQAFWHPTGTQRHSQSLAIWIPNSSAFFEPRRTVRGDEEDCWVNSTKSLRCPRHSSS